MTRMQAEKRAVELNSVAKRNGSKLISFLAAPSPFDANGGWRVNEYRSAKFHGVAER